MGLMEFLGLVGADESKMRRLVEADGGLANFKKR